MYHLSFDDLLVFPPPPCGVHICARSVFRCKMQCRCVVLYNGVCGIGRVSHVPGHRVTMIQYRGSVVHCIAFVSKEPATTAENRVIGRSAQMVFQVVHSTQSAVAIPASEGSDHITGEWVDEARNIWLIGIA